MVHRSKATRCCYEHQLAARRAVGADVGRAAASSKSERAERRPLTLAARRLRKAS